MVLRSRAHCVIVSLFDFLAFHSCTSTLPRITHVHTSRPSGMWKTGCLRSTKLCYKVKTLMRSGTLVCNELLGLVFTRMVALMIECWQSGLECCDALNKRSAVTVMGASVLTSSLRKATCLLQSAWLEPICKLLVVHSHTHAQTAYFTSEMATFVKVVPLNRLKWTTVYFTQLL